MGVIASLERWAIAGAMLLALAGCGGDPVDRLAEGGRGRVEAALAGGLVRLEGGTVVRLAGVDVPGRGEPGWAEARTALAGAVEGRPVALLHGGATMDGFGRPVAHLRTAKDRRWVQGALLEAGLARVRTTPDDRALAREMLSREARARAAGRGLWALDDWRVRLPEEVRPGFVLVEGRLAGDPRPGRTLAFVRGRLTLELAPRVRPDLLAAGVDLGAKSRRLVRVRGVVRSGRAGYVMTIDHAEQVEVLRSD